MSSNPMTALSVFSAIGTISAGKAQQQAYNSQAAQAVIKGRSQAIAYKQQGADVLRNLNQNLAAIVARAAAGGVMANTGSARGMQGYALKEGVREYDSTRDNAVLALSSANWQSSIYRQAGRNVMKAAYISAIGQVATGAAMDSQLKAPSLSPPPTIGAPVSQLPGPVYG
jgi:hypothetical protein